MAKMLVLSLLRTRFPGDILVFKNSKEPLFAVPRAGVREIYIEPGGPKGNEFWDFAQAWKFLVREHIETAGYDKVLFLDCDCLVLRNLAPMLRGDWEIAAYAEPGSKAGSRWFGCFINEDDVGRGSQQGVNGGVLAVRADRFHEVAAEWERINFGPSPRPKFFADQAALTRLIIDTPLRKHIYSRLEIGTPYSYSMHPDEYFKSYLVHLAGAGEVRDKLRFMLGLYVNTFFFDQHVTLLHLLDF